MARLTARERRFLDDLVNAAKEKAFFWLEYDRVSAEMGGVMPAEFVRCLCEMARQGLRNAGELALADRLRAAEFSRDCYVAKWLEFGREIDTLKEKIAELEERRDQCSLIEAGGRQVKSDIEKAATLSIRSAATAKKFETFQSAVQKSGVDQCELLYEVCKIAGDLQRNVRALHERNHALDRASRYIETSIASGRISVELSGREAKEYFRFALRGKLGIDSSDRWSQSELFKQLQQHPPKSMGIYHMFYTDRDWVKTIEDALAYDWRYTASICGVKLEEVEQYLDELETRVQKGQIQAEAPTGLDPVVWTPSDEKRLDDALAARAARRAAR